MTKDLAIQEIIKRYNILQKRTSDKLYNYTNYKIISEYDELFTKIAGISFILSSVFFLKITEDYRILEFNFIPCNHTQLILNQWTNAEECLYSISDNSIPGIICDVNTLIMDISGKDIIRDTGFHIIIDPFRNI